MPKKAFLVSFMITSRVVVDVKDVNQAEYYKVVAAAIEKIENNLGDYLHKENCEAVEEDEECPYDPNTDK